MTASDPFVEEGVEWVQVTLEGLSFLLYMIRKIIAAAVDGTPTRHFIWTHRLPLSYMR